MKELRGKNRLAVTLDSAWEKETLSLLESQSKLSDLLEDIIPIGEFETKGDLLVTDPCYEVGTWCSGKIKVKAGKYKAYVKRGEVDGWGDRVHALFIVHESTTLQEHFYKNTGIDVGVDSGQAGYFNANLYRSDLAEEVPLIGHEQYDRRSEVYSMQRMAENGLDLASFKRIMSEKVSEADLDKTMKEMKEYRESMLKEAREDLENIKPEDCEKSKDFYEVCCSMTLGNLGAGVEKFGAVSSSGFGDGGYSCFVNEGDEVVASYIQYISDEEECEECGCFMDECDCESECDGIGDGCEGCCVECKEEV